MSCKYFWALEWRQLLFQRPESWSFSHESFHLKEISESSWDLKTISWVYDPNFSCVMFCHIFYATWQAGFVRIDGSVAASQRPVLVKRFQASCVAKRGWQRHFRETSFQHGNVVDMKMLRRKNHGKLRETSFSAKPEEYHWSRRQCHHDSLRWNLGLKRCILSIFFFQEYSGVVIDQFCSIDA